MGLREASKLLRARHVFVSLHDPGGLRGHGCWRAGPVRVVLGSGLKVLEVGLMLSIEGLFC